LLSHVARTTTRIRRISSTHRRALGVTAAVAGSALVAVPALTVAGSGEAATPQPVANTAPAQHISWPADPNGLGHEELLRPLVTAKPTPAPATASSSRASRSQSRSTLPTSGRGTTATSGSPKAIAQSQLAARGWSGQFSCLDSLWTKESGWRVSASNPSGAYGIPQALPGSKMSSAGSDWQTNPATQIRWGLNYISSTYGSPCAAWSHSQSNNWY
jgi:hypothetical protein